jgi:hypothetical protein
MAAVVSVSITRSLQPGSGQAEALSRLIPRLSDALLAEALAVTCSLEPGGDQAHLLIDLMSYLEDPKLLAEAWTAIVEQPDLGWRAYALTRLPEIWPDDHELLDDAIAAVRAHREHPQKWRFTWHPYLAFYLARLASSAPDPKREILLSESLHALDENADDWYSEPLVLAATELPEAMRPRALDRVYEMLTETRDPSRQAAILGDLGRHFLEAITPDILHIALGVEQDDDERRPEFRYRDNILARLSESLATRNLSEGLKLLRSINHPEVRAVALRNILIQRLPDSPQDTKSDYEIWMQVMNHASLQDREDLLSDLVTLHVLITRLGGHEAIWETMRAIEDVRRWWP